MRLLLLAAEVKRKEEANKPSQVISENSTLTPIFSPIAFATSTSYPVNSSLSSWYVKGNDDLVEAVDKAIKELQDDGTLTKLSEKFLGKDFSRELSADEIKK